MSTRRTFLMGGAAAAFAAACAPRAQLHWGDRTAGGHKETVYVATLREMRTAEGTWSDALSQKVVFGQFNVLIPPAHQAGRIEIPYGRADYNPKLHFTLQDVHRFVSEDWFVQTVREIDRSKRKEAIVYIHGFNTTFAESLYSAAQLVHDMSDGAQTDTLLNMHYAWPSHGRALAYVADRDRSTLARDGLYEMLKALDRAGVEQIYLMPHSMGCALVMDVLRDIALRKDQSLHRKLSGVFLLSPDVNLNIFRNQARHYKTAFGRLPQPFTIFTSDKDRLLSLSALLSAQPTRLGNTENFSSLQEEFQIEIVKTGGESATGHSDVQQSPALQRIIGLAIKANSSLAEQDDGRRDLLDYATLGIQNTANTLLNPYQGLEE